MTHLSFRRARWYDFRKILEEAVAPRYSLLVSLTGETPSYYSLGQCNQDSKLEADGGGWQRHPYILQTDGIIYAAICQAKNVILQCVEI